MIITIDGPTASGKSTVGRLLAKKVGAYYLYTGLLYRALAYLLMKKFNYTLATIADPNMNHVEGLLDTNRFVYRYDERDRERIFFDDADITPQLKDKTIDQGASIVSTNKQVREMLNALQRKIAEQANVVIDGRDAGSVVFPHADYKFYVTANAMERARRWQMQERQKGNETSLEDAMEFLCQRDQRDSERKHAPLAIPQGAQVIDTTDLTINQVVETIVTLLH